ncbi:MAG: hypothetical protein QNK68_06205 [Flavobacteriales bacterium]
MALNRYRIHIYHGGESPEEIHFTDSLDEANSLCTRGEHSEIIDLKTKTIV